MTELEHTLAQERDLNDTLSHNLEESRGHAADQTNMNFIKIIFVQMYIFYYM